MEPDRKRRVSPVWEHFDLMAPNNPPAHWERLKCLDPDLDNVALVFLCAPTSVPCERVFLKAERL